VEKLLSGLLAAIPVLGLSAGPCSSKEATYKPIFEDAVRTVSARMYSDILRNACLDGRLYPASYIKNGFKRHYEELRLSVLGHGYTIIYTAIIQTNLPHIIAPLSQVAFDAERRLALPAQFGCFRAYWLDGSRR